MHLKAETIIKEVTGVMVEFESEVSSFITFEEFQNRPQDSFVGKQL